MPWGGEKLGAAEGALQLLHVVGGENALLARGQPPTPPAGVLVLRREQRDLQPALKRQLVVRLGHIREARPAAADARGAAGTEEKERGSQGGPPRSGNKQEKWVAHNAQAAELVAGLDGAGAADGGLVRDGQRRLHAREMAVERVRLEVLHQLLRGGRRGAGAEAGASGSAAGSGAKRGGEGV